MIDFTEMAKSAVAQSKEIIRSKEHQQQLERAAKEQRTSTAKSVLVEQVMPILRQAAIAFEAEGVSMATQHNSSTRVDDARAGKSSEIYFLSFYCYTDSQGGAPGARRMAGETFRFEHDGEKLITKKEGADYTQRTLSGSSLQDFVGPVVKSALESCLAATRGDR